MRTLRQGDTGEDVRAWETFLVGQGYYHGEVDGVFNDDTRQASVDFQRANNLTGDGVVGAQTFAIALKLGYPGVTDSSPDEAGPNWPPKPDFGPISSADRGKLFGTFAYVPAGIPGNPEAIRITDSWPSTNIVQVDVPQLRGITGAPTSAMVPFHRKGADQLKALWQAWEDAGLLPLVLSFAGTWAPRFIRGSQTYLSNHAWGTAFDINAGWNGLGAVPALKGKKGSTRELVALANENGFYWGGWFGGPNGGRPDGMHFEVARLI